MSIRPACWTSTERLTHVPDTAAAPIVMIRDMLDSDADAVLAVYAEGIATGHATFEHEMPTWERFSSSRHKSPRLVAEIGGQVVGWAAFSPVSSRPVYKGVAEHSVYVSAAARGQGVGHLLLSTFLEDAAAAGFWMVESRIFPEKPLQPGPALCLRVPRCRPAQTHGQDAIRPNAGPMARLHPGGMAQKRRCARGLVDATPPPHGWRIPAQRAAARRSRQPDAPVQSIRPHCG